MKHKFDPKPIHPLLSKLWEMDFIIYSELSKLGARPSFFTSYSTLPITLLSKDLLQILMNNSRILSPYYKRGKLILLNKIILF